MCDEALPPHADRTAPHKYEQKQVFKLEPKLEPKQEQSTYAAVRSACGVSAVLVRSIKS